MFENTNNEWQSGPPTIPGRYDTIRRLNLTRFYITKIDAYDIGQYAGDLLDDGKFHFDSGGYNDEFCEILWHIHIPKSPFNEDDGHNN